MKSVPPRGSGWAAWTPYPQADSMLRAHPLRVVVLTSRHSVLSTGR